MSFWDIVYYSWFAFLGLAFCSVFVGAYWDSTAAKRRSKPKKAAVQEKERVAEEEEPEEEAPLAAAEEELEQLDELELN